MAAESKDPLASWADLALTIGLGEATQVLEQRSFEEDGEDHGYREERREQGRHYRIVGVGVGHQGAHQREEDDDLRHLCKEVVLIFHVRSADAVGAIRQEADDEPEYELGRRRREEDGQPDEQDLAHAFEDLEPVHAELVASGQLAQRRRQLIT